MLILEGTDAVGKTSTSRRIQEKYGIECKDRSLDVITKYMEFDIPMEERARIYQEYLKSIDDKIVIMVNFDSEELLRRVHQREKISEYDLEAPKYNKLYFNTFLYMAINDMLEDKLFLADVTDLDFEAQVDTVYNAAYGTKKLNNYR